MNWFRKLWPGNDNTLGSQIVRVPSGASLHIPFPKGYTLDQWQSSPDLVNGWKKLESEDLYRHGMSVLYNNIPSGYPARGQTVNDTMANIELGRYQGYMDCMNLLQALSFDSPKSDEVPMDWNAEKNE
jgi:hypothetical protein